MRSPTGDAVAVSAGYGHSCCCTTEGELYTWGNNRDGCLGLPRTTKFVDIPQLVSCLYASPTNLALGRPTRQSSVFDNLGSEIAVDGDRSGDGCRKCSCTQHDPQGWWEVDLESVVHVQNIKIWNRCDEPTDLSMERDFYARRLFPCWIMVSQEPFQDDVGGAALLDAMNTAGARAHLTERCRCSTWRCPDHTMARYVRIQLEGFSFLHIAQVEVYGTAGARRAPGRVTQCSARKYVTTAVVAAADDPRDVDLAYKRAVQADAFNAEVLRQLETFFSAYDQWGRGDAIRGCLLCQAGSTCEICALKHEFRDDLKDLPLGPCGTLQPLSKIAEFLLDKDKPDLDFTSPVKKDTGVFSTVRSAISSLLFRFIKDSAAGTIAKDSDSDSEQLPKTRKATSYRGRERSKDIIERAAASPRVGTLSTASNSGTKKAKERHDKGRKYRLGLASGSTSSSFRSLDTTTTMTSSSSFVSGSDEGSSSTTAGGGGSSSTTTRMSSEGTLTTSAISTRPLGVRGLVPKAAKGKTKKKHMRVWAAG